MAKKVRRVKKKKAVSPPAVESSVEEVVERAPTKREKIAAAKEKSAESFHQEYAYVVKDLRRVLIVSGAMFLLLILLNLLLQ